MLRKLMKYEFKSTCRVYGVVYPVMVVLCLLTGLAGRSVWHGTDGTAFGILTMLMTTFLFAAVVITTVLNILRFYRGLFRDEGYLAHTLPVRPWQLIASKLIPAVVWTIATAAVMVLSLLMMQFITTADTSVILEIGSNWDLGADLPFLLEMLLAMLCELVCVILMIYASIALGHLFPRNRVAWAVGAWIGLTVVNNILFSMLGIPIIASQAIASLLGWNNSSGGYPYCLSLILWSLVWCVIYWAITQRVMTRKLNLE